MNPLNPWVALIEILILLGLAFALGRLVAWFQYRRPMQIQQEAIRRIKKELSSNDQIDSN